MMDADGPPGRSKAKGRPRNFDRAAALNTALKVFWQAGYEPTSVSDLCRAMNINPPSLYGAFGSKSKLFLEAVQHYEATYWDAVWDRFATEPDLHRAVFGFFHAGTAVLTDPNAPCGCLVVVGATNVAAESRDVHEALKTCRFESRTRFRERLARGVADGQLPPACNIDALASAMATLLQGLSMQARDLVAKSELDAVVDATLAMLPITAVQS